MALNINLYVHGIPMGQKTWGVQKEDSRFISSFYGPKWQAKELMQVDIMNCDGKTYCYYTFIKGQNVVAYDNRPGAYFALTIRMDAYYADLKNMYKILSAAYEKLCVGKLVQEQNGCVKFIVQGFSNLDAELKHVEERIVSYIGEFSNNKDIIPLTGFKANGQQTAITENLLECDNMKAHNTVKGTGKISLSPYYPSKEVENFISTKENEMRSLQQMASQQVEDARNKASQQVNDIRRSTNEELASVRRQADDDMSRLKSQYSNVDKQMNDLKQKIRQEQNRADQLQKEVNRLTTSLRQQEQEICKLHANSGGMAQAGYGKESGNVLSSILPFLNTLIIVGVASFLIWKTPSDNSLKLTQISMEIADLKDQMSGNQNPAVTNEQQTVENSQVGENEPVDLSKAKINIAGASFLRLGAPSQVTVKCDGQHVKNGKWTVSDPKAAIEQNSDGTAIITPTKPGEMEITYTVGDKNVKRKVTVK